MEAKWTVASEPSLGVHLGAADIPGVISAVRWTIVSDTVRTRRVELREGKGTSIETGGMTQQKRGTTLVALQKHVRVKRSITCSSYVSILLFWFV